VKPPGVVVDTIDPSVKGWENAKLSVFGPLLGDSPPSGQDWTFYMTCLVSNTYRKDVSPVNPATKSGLRHGLGLCHFSL